MRLDFRSLAKEKSQGAKDFLVDRAKLGPTPFRKSPDYMRRWGGKWYWTGALITVAFLYEVITGLVLLLYYNPADPYSATQYIVGTLPFGALLLSTHLFGAYAMIILVYVHMFRNYFVGAYKKPREIQWIIGVLLLALTMGVGYFGYSLTGDVLSVDAQHVGMGIAGAIPSIGPFLVNLGFGNGTTTSLFSRFLGWHIIMAALIAVLFGYHFYLAEANNMLPSGKISKYKAPAISPETSDLKPWYPYNFTYLTELGLMTIGFIILVPSFLGLFKSLPILISPYPGPSPTSALAALIPPYPPWFLLFAYKAVDFSVFTSSSLGPLEAMTIFSVIPLIYFLVVPFLDRSNSLHPLERPFVTSVGVLSIVYLVILSIWGAFTPGLIVQTPQVAEALLPPFVVTFGLVFGISKLWKDGKLKFGAKTITSSFFVFMAGLVAMIFMTGYFAVHSVVDFNISNNSKLILSFGSLAFMAIGTARVASKLPDRKFKGTSKTGYIAIGVITVLAWVLLGISIKLSPITQQMMVGLILGTVFILSGISVAIYRRVVYGE